MANSIHTMIGPPHLPKILRQKVKTTKVILNELPITVSYNLLAFMDISQQFYLMWSTKVTNYNSMTIFTRPPETKIGAKQRNFRLLCQPGGQKIILKRSKSISYESIYFPSKGSLNVIIVENTPFSIDFEVPVYDIPHAYALYLEV